MISYPTITPTQAIASIPVADQSAFIIETTTLLGAAGVFTGPLRDCAAHNWAGAKAAADVTGTVDVDESSAASAAKIYQVATQATTASPAAHGAPATFVGFEGRVAPTKTVHRFVRVVYVNGAGAQVVTFELMLSLSPLN